MASIKTCLYVIVQGLSSQATFPALCFNDCSEQNSENLSTNFFSFTKTSTTASPKVSQFVMGTYTYLVPKEEGARPYG